MKIDEPNTPYTHYDSGAESDDSRRPKSPANQKQALSWDNLQTRLDSVAAVREQYPSSPLTDHSDAAEDAEEERKREMRRLEFREHRKRHYNEMEAVRKFRAEHPDDLDMEGDADIEDGNTSD
jgi:protein phosphatase inhibitor 2